MSGRRTLSAFAAFVAVVVGANVATAQLGVTHWLGLTATAGTWLAGFGFVARDTLQDRGGKRWVIAAIMAGALLSAILSPRLALASAAAFTLSELLDFAIYTPLRDKSRPMAALASNTAGAVVDTVVFLAIAGFPLSGTFSQVVIKVGATSLFIAILGGARAVLRQPLHAEGGAGHE